MTRHVWVLAIACALGAACDDFDESSSPTNLVIEDVVPSALLSGGAWSVDMIRVGLSYGCALEPDGEAFCWGDNQFGQLGDGTVSDRNVPTAVVGGHAFVEIDARGSHTCAVTSGGAAYCWGSNEDGQLGDGTTTSRREPTRVLGDHVFRSVSAGTEHTCAIDENAEAWCWGDNLDGELGNGTFGTDSNVPTQVTGGHEFVSIDVQDTRTCALEADGSAWCWGFNADRDTNSATPGLQSETVRFDMLVQTGTRSCGVGTDALVWCWGDNEVTGAPLRTEPTLVHPDREFVAVSDNGGPCGLDTAGDLWCWNWATFAMTSISSGNDIASFSGRYFSDRVTPEGVPNVICVLDHGGIAYCRGQNDSGQLGDGTNVDRGSLRPVLTPRASPGDPQGVSDLAVASVTARTARLTWTEVDDGTGNPARYRVRYSEDLTVWKDGEIGCASTIRGTEIGARIFCTVEDLDPDTHYEFQLMSFRVVDGRWVGARLSNLEEGETGGLIVDDLAYAARTRSANGISGTTTVRWTQVDDGTGQPALYRVRHAAPEIRNWKDATIACSTVRGENIGFDITCSFPSGMYVNSQVFEVQLMSYRVVDGAWRDAHYSNIAVIPGR